MAVALEQRLEQGTETTGMFLQMTPHRTTPSRHPKNHHSLGRQILERIVYVLINDQSDFFFPPLFCVGQSSSHMITHVGGPVVTIVLDQT